MSECDKANIVGYIEQTPEQIEMINVFKQREKELLAFVNEWFQFQKYDDIGFDHRWMAIAKTHFQEGFMAAVRAIARPKGD